MPGVLADRPKRRVNAGLLTLHEGKAGGQVGCREALALARNGRGEENDLLTFLQHILEIGTHVAEDFFHQAVLVFENHDGAGFGFLNIRDVTYDGYIGDALNVGTAFYLETQQAGQVNASDGERQSQHESHHIGPPGRGSSTTRPLLATAAKVMAFSSRFCNSIR